MSQDETIWTIHTGETVAVRPMSGEDLPRDCAGETFDPRWHVARWLGEGQREPGDFDCPAWVDHGRLFLPLDGDNRSIDFYPEGPKNTGRNWYDAKTGRLAVTRTSAPLWYTRTGPLAES